MSSNLVVRRTVIAIAVVVLATGAWGGGATGLASPAAAGNLEEAGHVDGAAVSWPTPSTAPGATTPAEYSSVDATSFVLMWALRIEEAFAFDGDFTAAGFVELRP